MLKIDGQDITLTRGDSLAVQLNLTYNNEPYEPVEGDAITFAMKRFVFDPGEPVLTKSIPTDTLMFELAPADTKTLDFGEYAYDIQMTFADGTVDTFIANARFILDPEVN